MRILIGTSPLAGHINPLSAIARGLLEAGHEVLWYTSHRFETKIDALGATFFPFVQAREIDPLHLDTLYPERTRLQGLARLKFDLRKVFLSNLEGQRADLLDICEMQRPDALVIDLGFAGAVVVKYHLQIPLILCNVSPLPLSSPNIAPFGLGFWPSTTPLGCLRNRFSHWFLQTVIMRDIQRECNARLKSLDIPRLESFLFDALVTHPDLFLQPTTPKFEYPRSNFPENLHFVGPILPSFPDSFVEPTWWSDLMSDRPVVLVTQGTLTNDPHNLILPTIWALADEDVLVVVTTANRPVSQLGALPPNVRAERFIPHNRLFPLTDVFVTNGGYGAVQAALAHGIPIVASGRTEDKAEVCARIAWSGVGINLKTDTPTVEQLKQAILQVLHNPQYRRQAHHLRDDFARYDAPRQAVTLIENLVQ